MSKKLFIGVVPVIAAFALAVTPIAAQAAEGHYFTGGLSKVSNRVPGGEKLASVAWGTLSLTNLTTGGKVSCHNVIGAVEENPEPGGEAGPAGVGETQSFNPYECESEACTATATGGGPATYISVMAEGSAVPFPNTGSGTMAAPNVSTEEPLAASGTNLRWKNVLINEGTKVRQESKNVKVNVICHVMTGANGKGEPEYAAQIPEISTGNNQPVGVTHCCTASAPPELSFDSKSGTLTNEKAQKGKTEGALKTLGYAGEEVINTQQG
jgi:hypothetical protein